MHAHISLLQLLRAASLACCRLIGEDVWPVTAGLSRSLWQVGNKICQTLNLDCNLTVTVTPQGTVNELGLQEAAHTESESSGGGQQGTSSSSRRHSVLSNATSEQHHDWQCCGVQGSLKCALHLFMCSPCLGLDVLLAAPERWPCIPASQC